MAEQRTALVTVATEQFVPGCAVMLRSFLDHHPEEVEALLVVHDGLSHGAAERLKAISPRVELVRAGQDIAARVAGLAQALPAMANTSARFLSLEGLRPRGFARVLLCDADILFLAPLGDFLAPTMGLRAVGDGCHLRGKARSLTDFAEVEPGPGALSPTFNAGLVLLGEDALTAANFASLLDLLGVETFGRSKSGLHDQLLLNLQFARQVELVSYRYNYLLRHHALIREVEQVAPADICVVHYNIRHKPWEDAAGAPLKYRDPLRKWAARAWHAAAARLGG